MSQKTYTRFPASQRIEHVLLVLSFGLLGLTGLPQMFSQLGISQFIIQVFGGIEAIRIVHRICATVLMFETLYHIVLAGYKIFVLKVPLTMVPGVRDGVNIYESVMHNIGLRKEAPKMGRYNYAEKMEYWAMMWGLFVMGVSGFMLWNPITTTKFLPGVFVPAAKVAHGWEGFLAIAAILIWHFYHVHIKKWNWSMINGKMDHETMEEEHALEIEDIEAGLAGSKATTAEIKRRQKVYFPIAGVFSLVFLVAIYFFVSYESTAIETVPRQENQVVVFSPQTPTPLPTLAPIPTTVAAPAGGLAAATSWDKGIGAIFTAKCGACHGELGGFSVENYASAMKGSDNGVMIVAGDSENSALVIQQAEGKHMGNFTPEELEVIKAWIDAGAAE